MARSSSTFRRPALASVGLAGVLAASVAGSASAQEQAPAAASSSCGQIQTHLNERSSLVRKIQALGGKDKKMDPKAACAAFGKLVVNGKTMLKWADANKDWCQIPDQFVEGFKADHARAQQLQGQACGVAAKQAEMEKKARQQAQQAQQGGGGSGGLLGGGGLEGSWKMPQGAL